MPGPYFLSLPFPSPTSPKPAFGEQGLYPLPPGYEVNTRRQYRGTIRARSCAQSDRFKSQRRTGLPLAPCGRGRISPICPSQIGLGNPGEGCPAGRFARVASRSRRRRRARNGSLAGAARIGDGGAKRPAGYPSPGFAKLAARTPPSSAPAEVCSPSETALSHKGRGGASSCAADRVKQPRRCVNLVALRAGPTHRWRRVG